MSTRVENPIITYLDDPSLDIIDSPINDKYRKEMAYIRNNCTDKCNICNIVFVTDDNVAYSYCHQKYYHLNCSSNLICPDFCGDNEDTDHDCRTIFFYEKN